MPVSTGHRIVEASEITDDLLRGWQRPEIAVSQGLLVDTELNALRDGNPPRVYEVAAQALRNTGMARGRVLEIGCASGYYSEVLETLLGSPVEYIGVDYSEPLIRQARSRYPRRLFLVGDACRVPLRNAAAPVVVSGCVLLHVPSYEDAVRETARLTSDWAIFHRTPVLTQGKTVTMRKLAYGVPVVELAFNEDELRQLFDNHGLVVQDALEVDHFALPHVAEPVRVTTFVCRRRL